MTYKYPCGIVNNKLIRINEYKKIMGEISCPVCKKELIYCDGEKIKCYFKLF